MGYKNKDPDVYGKVSPPYKWKILERDGKQLSINLVNRKTREISNLRLCSAPKALYSYYWIWCTVFKFRISVRGFDFEKIMVPQIIVHFHRYWDDFNIVQMQIMMFQQFVCKKDTSFGRLSNDEYCVLLVYTCIMHLRFMIDLLNNDPKLHKLHIFYSYLD
jgi:hypothetical protein